MPIGLTRLACRAPTSTFKLSSFFRRQHRHVSAFARVRAMEMDPEMQMKIYPPKESWHIVLKSIKEKKVAIIGDIHGCLDEFRELLEKCNADHLIIVGDMINKGPKNRETLEFIKKLPNATFIRGNHEDSVLQSFYTRQTDPTFKPHMAWVDGLSADDVAWIAALPFTITLPEYNAIVVHAGLVPAVALTDQSAHTMTSVRNLRLDGSEIAADKDPEAVPWGSVWNGPQHVYFGHDAKRKLQLHSHATGLDTGCVYGFKLTACLLPSKELVSVDARAVHCKPGRRGDD